jgi:DNA-directed RNA polymerase subunit beta'
MGHINLVSPVTNISLFKTISTNLSKILDISTKNLEDIIYFRSYVVIDNGTTNLLSKGEVLEKKVEPLQISGILNELIESGTAEEGVVSEAKNLKKEIEAKKDDDAIFLEDYLNFLSKHKGLKILTGTEAFHELLKGINVKEYLETIKKGIGKESFRNSKIRFLQSFEKTNVNLE